MSDSASGNAATRRVITHPCVTHTHRTGARYACAEFAITNGWTASSLVVVLWQLGTTVTEWRPGYNVTPTTRRDLSKRPAGRMRRISDAATNYTFTGEHHWIAGG